MEIQVELARVLIRETEDSHVVELREIGGERTFPIVIGFHEAAAIERCLMSQKPPRPQTHELLANLIKALGAEVEKLVISDLRDHTFYARLHLRLDGRLIDVDSRPSDAIALGVAMDVPFYVEQRVFDEVSNSD